MLELVIRGFINSMCNQARDKYSSKFFVNIYPEPIRLFVYVFRGALAPASVRSDIHTGIHATDFNGEQTNKMRKRKTQNDKWFTFNLRFGSN